MRGKDWLFVGIIGLVGTATTIGGIYSYYAGKSSLNGILGVGVVVTMILVISVWFYFALRQNSKDC